MKKMMSKAYLLILFMSMIILCRVPVHANDPNWNGARVVKFDTDIIDNTVNGESTQQNVYKFTADKPGGIYLTLKYPRQADTANYWTIDMYNDRYDKVMASYEVPGNYTQVNLPVVGLDRGVYYVVIKSIKWSSAATTDRYTLVIHQDTNNLYEKERNEEFLTANPINADTTYYGSTNDGESSEKDFFKLAVSNPGAVKVNFSHDQMNDTGYYWTIRLYDEQYTKYCERDIYGNSTSYTFPSIGLKTGTLYVEIVSSKWSSAKSASKYALRVNYEKSDFWEKELNEDFSSATPISLESTYQGSVYDGESREKDYYKFEISEADNYDIVMTTALMGSDNKYYTLRLYDSTYKELTSKDIQGTITTNTIGYYLPSGVYYICVTSYSWNSGPEETYSIRVAKANPAQAAVVDKSLKSTKITSLASKKKAVTIKWKKQTSGINGYEIQYSTNKKFQKDVKTVTINKAKTASKTIKKLKSKKKYFFRIRTFKKSGAGKVYSNWSKTKNVKVK